ncbi:MAG: ACT domain-containing protein [Deltaproteobacteria bacterium]|nr:ACT domain-containing protein [Deltaproteobacteria bacterium]
MGHFSLSVVGKDRPGIVAEVTRVLYELGCNIEDSSCTILSGQFAMILVIVHRQYSIVPEIDSAFDPLRKEMRLTISLHELEEEEASRENKYEGKPYVISVYGADRPGIVHAVARELAAFGVNVTDMPTQVVGPEERPVYVMVLEAAIPDAVELKELDGAFERIRKELAVSISMRPIDPVEL